MGLQALALTRSLTLTNNSSIIYNKSGVDITNQHLYTRTPEYNNYVAYPITTTIHQQHPLVGSIGQQWRVDDPNENDSRRQMHTSKIISEVLAEMINEI